MVPHTKKKKKKKLTKGITIDGENYTRQNHSNHPFFNKKKPGMIKQTNKQTKIKRGFKVKHNAFFTIDVLGKLRGMFICNNKKTTLNTKKTKETKEPKKMLANKKKHIKYQNYLNKPTTYEC